ncbi:hypothetical protein MK489_20235 [Myxococcota bacterium]|nr:hypothetical protein [Myxococcota bacterium]
MPTRATRAAWSLVVGVGVAVVFFLVVEGTFSSWTALKAIFPQDRIAERHHTHHDPLLGWVNVPGSRLPDFYGPGRDLTIDARGFRSGGRRRDLASERFRSLLICSGDSFAMGYGVGDDHTWCRGLEKLHPDLETLNMGQGGYGLDQSFLWFQRDAADLDHDIHLFTFTTGDFERMLWDEFSGYQKPLLVEEEGRLVVANAPLPEPGWMHALRRAPFKLMAFRSVQALFDFSQSLGELDQRQAIRSSQQARVILGIFRELAALNAGRDSKLAAVLLPTESEVSRGGATRESGLVLRELTRVGIPFWDLTADFQGIPGAELSSHFISSEDPMVGEYPGAPGHYNERGNAFVAEALSRRLQAYGWLEEPVDSSSKAD